MTQNRSVPVDTVLPHVIYGDVIQAIDWLTKAFGATEHYRYGEPVSGAQVFIGKASIMLKKARSQSTGHTHYLTIFVDNVDEHYKRAKSAGARITEELNETCYGERQYGVEDLEGHFWLFSQHVQDLSPDDWGAAIKNRS